MPTVKGVLTFPTLFHAKCAKGSDVPKYNTGILFPPGDPQIVTVQREVDAAKQNTFPNGLPAKADLCFGPYDVKIPKDKDYYDPRFSGWHLLTCTAKEEDRPAVVDLQWNKILDPGAVFSGAIAHVSLGISGYVKGTGGVGGWLNGVMLTGDLCDFGRLDNRPTVEQMFGSMDTSAGTPPPAPNAAPPPAPPAVHQMLPAAGGCTYEQMITAGWNDEQLIANQMMVPPGGVTPSFAG